MGLGIPAIAYTGIMTMHPMPEMGRLGLAFRDAALEQAFQAHYDGQYHGYTRAGILLGLALYLVFGILDRFLFPEVYPSLWLLRFGAATPLMLVFVTLLFLFHGPRISQALTSITIIIAGLSIVAMIQAIPVARENPYYAGLMLVIFYAHSFVRLQFRWATLATVIILLAYELVVFLLRAGTPLNEILAGNFFFLTATLMGMVTSYIMEYDARRQFLLQQNLAEERNLLEQANRRLNEINVRLDAQAHVDELTGIPNRRSFFEHLDREWRRQLRAGDEAQPLALLLIDIDYFKRYNDYYGHPAGDRCLKRIAGLIRDFAKRPGDLAARIGGEEFVLLLPETDLEAARELAERMRERVAEEGITHLDSPAADFVSISVGVASMRPRPGARPSELVHMADRALYEAKRGGRNLVASVEVGLV